jgi:hypothetical protein
MITAFSYGTKQECCKARFAASIAIRKFGEESAQNEEGVTNLAKVLQRKRVWRKVVLK